MAKNIRELSQGNRNIWNLDPRIIKIATGFNVRDEGPELDAHIETIALSIKAKGYDQSKAVTIFEGEDGYYISDGHCRLRATMLAIKLGADIKRIPVVTEARGINEADRVLGLITRNSGKNLSPLEQGRVYKRLAGFGWDEKEMAEGTGKSIGHVRQMITLMEAKPETHQQIVANKVSATAVAEAVREHGPAKAAKVVTDAIKQSGGKRATARAVAAASSGETRTKERTLSQVEDFFSACIREQDVAPGVIRVAEAFMAFRMGKSTPEQFAERLAELCGELAVA